MSDERICENCVHCYQIDPPKDSKEQSRLECRFEPPKPMAIPVQGALGQMSMQILAVFPVVHPHSWCSQQDTISKPKLVS